MSHPCNIHSALEIHTPGPPDNSCFGNPEPPTAHQGGVRRLPITQRRSCSSPTDPPPTPCRSASQASSTVAPWTSGPSILHWEILYYGMFRSLPGLCLLGARRNHPATQSWLLKLYPGIAKCPVGENCPQLRTTIPNQPPFPMSLSGSVS